MRHSARNTGGFTLIEMVTAVLVMATLAGIALPSLRDAVAKADAAAIVSDAETVGLASLELLTETGTYPATAGWGEIPPGLEDRLPDGFDFEHRGSDYLWASLSSPGPILFGSRHIGLLAVRHSDPRLAEAMRAHRGATVYWTPQFTLFVIPG